MLRLLGRASSINVRKVLWTCAELGLAVEREDWGAGFRSTRTPEFLALNPNAMVPVLIDAGLVLWESNAIIRYLAGQYAGQHLYPAAAQARAPIEQWLDWQVAELNRAWSYGFSALVRNDPAQPDPQRLAASIASWSQCMSLLDQQLARTGGHVAGREFSLADIPVGLSVNRWFCTPIERPELPAVTAYYQRLSTRPGFIEHGRNGLP